jgi:hypothetical protein
MKLGDAFRARLVCAVASLLLDAQVVHAAPTKEACIATFDAAQRSRRAGTLRRAREELLVCAQAACPSVVRADCADLLREVEVAQPTIALKAVDAKGADLVDASVTFDGVQLATTLDGRAIPVDPGKLSLVFRHASWAPVRVDVVITEGEKGRVVQAALRPPQTDVEPRATPRRPLLAWIVPTSLGAVSMGAFAFGGYTRLRLGNHADDLRAQCAPECSQQVRDQASSDLATANVALGVGIGMLVLAATAWFVLAPRARLTSAGTQRAALAW